MKRTDDLEIWGQLFGPMTDDVFRDSDRNGRIDENDATYSRLRVWAKKGEQETFDSPQAHNIDAIFIGNIETPYRIKSGQNTTEGIIRRSGVYLTEGGGAGIIQKIDVLA